MIHSRL
jgi:hypothetical protein